MQELERLLKGMVEDVREIKEEVINLKIEQTKFLTRDVAEEKFYSKGELDKALLAIKEFTASVKELLTLHTEDDREGFNKIDSRLNALAVAIEKSAEKGSDRMIDVGRQVIFFLLGVGSSFLPHILK